MSEKKDNLKEQVKQTSQSTADNNLKAAAQQAKTDLTNAGQTIAGNIAGQVEGGIQSLEQKRDQIVQDFNETKSTITGALNGDAQSIANLKATAADVAVGAITAKFGAKVEVQFSEPDSNGIVTPISASLDETGGIDGTIAAVIQLITGLGAGEGFADLAKDAGRDILTNTITSADPTGLLDAGAIVDGNLGAAISADALATATENAITSVTNELEASVSGNLENLNGTYSFVSEIDSASPGSTTDLVETRTIVDNVVSGYANGATVTGMPDANEELSKAIAKTKTAGLSDIAENLGADKELRQDLTNTSDFENLSGGKDGAKVVASIQNKTKSAQTYNNRGNEYQSLIRSRSKNSEVGVVQGLNAELNEDLTNRVKSYASKLTDTQVQQVIQRAQGDAGAFSEARTLLTSIGKKSFESATNFLKTINSTITNSTRPTPSEKVFAEPYVIGSFDKNWQNGQGDPYFPYISSLEELEGEMRNISRDVTEVVVHWTETHTNRNIGSEEINKYHLELGLDGIGYHYVIRRDGSLQRGRPINLEGQHAPINSHDQRSIGVVFVGGINVPSGTPNSENFLDVQSLTRSQFNTFDHLCRAFYNAFPGGQVVGHSEIDEDEVDPGFDVIDYVESVFGKKSKFEDPLSDDPLTVDEILS